MIDPSQKHHPQWSVGLVGFSYPEWSTTFYAATTGAGRASSSHRLEIYARTFSCVEINTSFYAVPSLDTVRAWNDATPPNFRFTVKVPRDITHGPTPPGLLASPHAPPAGHLLRDDTLSTARRLLDAVTPLGAKLGALLMQLPPTFSADRLDELAGFLDRLASPTPLAIEFRHDSWWQPKTATLLRDRGVCWVCSDESPHREAARAPTTGDTRPPRPIVATTNLLYVRLLGKHGQFPDRTRERIDPTPRLRWWKTRLEALASQHPAQLNIMTFFDNDFAGHAPATAQRFATMLGLPPPARRQQTSGEATLFDAPASDDR